ncbi:MAG: SDR family oxidoreductase [Opitutaceae bacterium]
MNALDQKLAGKTAIVTGAGRGLGRAYAVRLARLGANVAVVDLNLNSAEEFGEIVPDGGVAAECASFGVRAIGIQADMTRRDAVDAMVSRVNDELGSVDILVNNAGGMLRPAEVSSAMDSSEEDFRFIMDVNLMSTVFCCQAAGRLMKAQGGGRIVNVASVAAVKAGLRLVSYGTAKAAIIRYTRSLARELGPHGINVNCIAPAIIASSRAMAEYPERRAMAADIPLRRLGELEDCAKVIEFLCTDLSDYVTGQCIAICGGLYAGAV